MQQFGFTPDEVERIHTWQRSHQNEKHPNPRKMGAIGGSYTFSFTPTTLGCVSKVKCHCGDELDLTDYEDW